MSQCSISVGFLDLFMSSLIYYLGQRGLNDVIQCNTTRTITTAFATYSDSFISGSVDYERLQLVLLEEAFNKTPSPLYFWLRLSLPGTLANTEVEPLASRRLASVSPYIHVRTVWSPPLTSENSKHEDNHKENATVQLR